MPLVNEVTRVSGSAACPCCADNVFAPLADYGVVPHSGSFLQGMDDRYRTLHLAFDYCSACALIRRRILDEDTHDYSDVSRKTGHRLSGYTVEIAKSLRGRVPSTEDLIIDVGANDGRFLTILAQAGFRKRLGVEPSHACAAACRAAGHAVENTHLDATEANRIRERYGEARVVTCRHTLEHVPDPFGLLLAMRTLLRPDGLLFVEVPDAHEIVEDLRGYELWDEHLHSFTPANLMLLCSRAGFYPEEAMVMHHRGAPNILCWNTLSAQGCQPDRLQTRRMVHDGELCRSFPRRWKTFRNNLLSDLPAWPKPIAFIGASHPQANFLLFTGLGRQVAFLVDDDPAKAGRFLPIPQPVPIRSSVQFLADTPPGTIVRGAFGYDDWMDRLLAPLVPKGVHVVCPYDPSFLPHAPGRLAL
jgi:SAM-dependent methyltransferase